MSNEPPTNTKKIWRFTPRASRADSDSGGSQTLERGIRLLELLAARPDGLTVTAISAEMQTHRAGIYRLLKPLEAARLVERKPSGVYTLGVEVLPGDRPGSKVKVKLRNEKGKVQVRKQFPQARAQRSSFAATLEPLPPSGAVLVVDLTNVTPERDRRHDSELNRLAIYARIRSADGPVLDDQYVTIEVPRSDGEALLRHPIVFDLPPGEYAVEVSVSDLVGHGRATATTKIEPKD